LLLGGVGARVADRLGKLALRKPEPLADGAKFVRCQFALLGTLSPRAAGGPQQLAPMPLHSLDRRSRDYLAIGQAGFNCTAIPACVRTPACLLGTEARFQLVTYNEIPCAILAGRRAPQRSPQRTRPPLYPLCRSSPAFAGAGLLVHRPRPSSLPRRRLRG